MKAKRIISFLPSATELIYELGAQDRLFGVTHECVYPSDASKKPRVIESVFEPEKMSSQEIDDKICELAETGEEVYKLVTENVSNAKPDLIILDEKNKEIFILEAEFSKNVLNGIKQLDGFSTIENKYCKKYYPEYKCKRFVILYGDESSNAKEVIFTLTTEGEIICSKNCPEIIVDAVDKIQNS